MTRTDALLVRESDLGNHSDAGPRSLPEADRFVRFSRQLLLPLSSAMRVVTTQRTMALTYDDGPHRERTPEILDELAKRDIRATFFVLTDRAQTSPQIIHRMLASGHEVALHGIDHTRLPDLFWPSIVWRIWQGKRRLERVCGQPVTMYRPTYGAQTLIQHLTARMLGMEVVFWSAWASDWFEDEAEQVADRAIAARHPGGILLLHDTTDDAPDGVEPTFSRGEVTARVVDGLAADGYRLVPAGELLADHRAVHAVTTQRPWVGLARRVRSVLRRRARA